MVHLPFTCQLKAAELLLHTFLQDVTVQFIAPGDAAAAVLALVRSSRALAEPDHNRDLTGAEAHSDSPSTKLPAPEDTVSALAPLIRPDAGEVCANSVMHDKLVLLIILPCAGIRSSSHTHFGARSNFQGAFLWWSVSRSCAARKTWAMCMFCGPCEFVIAKHTRFA